MSVARRRAVRLMRRLTGIAIACLTLTVAVGGCKSGGGVKPSSIKSLRLVTTYALDLVEPSDLAINDTGTALWTVTNDPDSVYQLDMSGHRVKTLNYAGHNLEGIAYDPSDQTLWVVEENRREVVHLDLDGNVLSTHPLSLTGEQNSGLEGICLNGAGSIFLLNEKLPGLFIALDPAKAIASTDTLTFAGDYSGMSYEPATAAFWIVSDQSRRLYLWNEATGVTKEYLLPFEKAEGVAYHAATNRIYIVSDSERRLYVYDNVEQN